MMLHRSGDQEIRVTSIEQLQAALHSTGQVQGEVLVDIIHDGIPENTEAQRGIYAYVPGEIPDKTIREVQFVPDIREPQTIELGLDPVTVTEAMILEGMVHIFAQKANS
jgi:hypothetical protein